MVLDELVMARVVALRSSDVAGKDLLVRSRKGQRGRYRGAERGIVLSMSWRGGIGEAQSGAATGDNIAHCPGQDHFTLRCAAEWAGLTDEIRANRCRPATSTRLTMTGAGATHVSPRQSPVHVIGRMRALTAMALAGKLRSTRSDVRPA